MLSLLMQVIRGHWQVENCPHWLKDRYWREDKHYLKRPGLGAVYASLTNGAVSTLRLLMRKDEVVMKAKAEDMHDDPKTCLKKTQMQMTLQAAYIRALYDTENGRCYINANHR